MDFSSEEIKCPRSLYYSIGLPLDDELKAAHYVYKPTLEIQTLPRECKRTILAEKFIENPKQGTLHDLVVRRLATYFYGKSDNIYDDPLDEILHYDEVPLDLPLEEMYMIEHPHFWKRYVTSISKDVSLRHKKDVKWKCIGIAMKFASILEESRPDYFFADDLLNLANLIKDYIKELHITKLKPLQDEHFNKYFLSETDSMYETPSERSETISTQPSESSDLPLNYDLETLKAMQTAKAAVAGSGDLLVDDEEEEDWSERSSGEMKELQPAALPVPATPIYDFDNETTNTLSEEMMEEGSINYDPDDQDLKQLRKAKRKAKAAQIIRRAEREVKRAIRHQRFDKNMYDDDVPKPKKKKQQVNVKSVYDIPVEESEQDEMEQIPDKRNIAQFLERQKKFKYDSLYCHHIDLSLIGVFTAMKKLSLTFEPGDLGFKYHPRFFRFSYRDMDNLARGLKQLVNLKVFRFTNSELDEKKLKTLVNALNHIRTLEEVDLSYNSIKDYFGYPLRDLIAYQRNLRILVLDFNFLNKASMHKMANGLRSHSGSQMEVLSLSFNPIGNEALQEIVTAILETEHFSTINLTGINITSEGICKSIAWGLIHSHSQLKHLNMIGVKTDRPAAIEILKTLYRNYTLLSLDRKGCDIEEELDMEISVALQRNEYMYKNPYIHNESYKLEDILAFMDNRTHPILTNSLKAMETKVKCLANVNEFEQTPEPSEEEDYAHKSSVSSLKIKKKVIHSENIILDTIIKDLEVEPFEDINDLNLAQFKKLCSLPGLQQRYSYLKRQQEFQQKALEARQNQRLAFIFHRKKPSDALLYV